MKSATAAVKFSHTEHSVIVMQSVNLFVCEIKGKTAWWISNFTLSQVNIYEWQRQGNHCLPLHPYLNPPSWCLKKQSEPMDREGLESHTEGLYILSCPLAFGSSNSVIRWALCLGSIGLRHGASVPPYLFYFLPFFAPSWLQPSISHQEGSASSTDG